MATAKFISSAERIVAFDNRFREENQTEGALTLYKSELQDMWDLCRSNYEDCLNQISADGRLKSDSKQEDCDAISHKYITTFETYACLFGRITELLKSLSTPVQPIVPQVSEPRPSYGFKVPPCDIEDFKGDYLSWPTFRDLFSAIYVENTRLSKVEKLYHLLQKTKGNANLLIKRIPLTNDGFDMAWQTLMGTYENKRVLTNTQLEIFYKLQPVRFETSASLQTLQRSVCGVLDSLKLLGIDISSWDPLIVFHCCQRLPESTLTLWEQSILDKTSLPSWESLNSFLTARHQTLESVAGMKATTVSQAVMKPPQAAQRQLRAHHANVQSAPHRNKCPLCQSSHRLRTCDKFKAMTAIQRYDLIKSKGMCINCLDTSHTVSACTSTFTCAICTMRHHTMLHFKEPLRRPAQNTSSSGSRLEQSAVPVQDGYYLPCKGSY